ncbi:N-acetylglucosaminyldiphosphoundecaprenol N-acetyl-beta-D-mannosaminyltransferase [Treponema rectale]|uniref:N-acetylglucosaminyldiphosphoundecaprenol N-acetyl-beta-D-mannosaminyltransferase n=1 Tax=Treponema rectale TaxID=744512 RepID=A0A840SAD2_9SPIR|nr:WecB/TagA/CpsF family glycosyltransferase [Treponema rectale]MBB5218667.1 N-acetylglucosaminyldiphosphoundecaprenol N-acetyl-beta-D-mannosaminyltransferase [Treponema rectale]
MAVERINLLGVGIDICKPEDMEKTILDLLDKQGPKQIVFLNIWDFLKARGKSQYAECVRNADLVIPISKSILGGAKFLKKTVPVRYNPFNALINILSILENHYKSVYFLGGRKKTVMTAEKNVRSTFKNLQIVGRCVGYYHKSIEEDVVQAIYKACPSLVLMSEGIKEKDCWSYSRRDRLNSSIFLFYNDAIGIFSDRKKRISEKTFEHGTEFLHELAKKPLKIVLIFPFFYYIIRLVWEKIFKKG